MPLTEQELLRERYEIQSVLGRGGFATTYLALDREQNRRCVVKALELRRVDTVKTHELFEREARVLANLHHTNIPDFIDFFSVESEQDIEIYLVQEYFEGKNLAELLVEGKHFTEQEAVDIAVAVAEILAYLQSLSPPIIHRDIKPSNILLSPSGEVYLVDFGAVRDKTLQEPLLQPGGPTVVGTYGYMPLEQFEGQAVPASDIYSLGATLVHLLSRKEPWTLERDGMRLDFRPHVNVSRRFARVLERMIEPDWRKRHAAASELIEDLKALRGEKQRLWSKRLGALVAVAAVAVVVASWLVVSPRDEVTKNRRRTVDVVQSWLTGDAPEVDSLGDPLPDGAVMRLGTARLRHAGPVHAVAFSPDGRILASGGEDRAVKLWDVSTGKLIDRFETYMQVRSLDFSPDGKKLVSSGSSSNVHVWDVEKRSAVLRILPTQVKAATSRPFQRAVFSPDGKTLATSGLSSAIQIWGVRSGTKVRDLPVSNDDIRFMDWTHGGRSLLWLDRSGTAECFDLDTSRKASWSLERVDVPLAVSGDGLRLATSTYGKVSIREPNTGEEISRFPTPSPLAALAFAPDGGRLAGAGSDCRIFIWDVESGEALREITCPAFARHFSVRSVDFSPEGGSLATGHDDGSVRLWDIESGREAFTFPGHRNTVATVSFSPDGKILASGGADHTIRYWDSSGVQDREQLLGADVRKVAFLPENRLFASEVDRYHVWDLESRWEMLEMPLEESDGSVISPDGEYLAMANKGALRILETLTGEELDSHALAEEEIPLALSPDGSLLALRKGPLTLVVRDRQTGDQVFQSKLPEGWPLSSASFAPNGRFLATGLTLWTVGDPSTDPRLAYRGFYGWGGSSIISPDNRLLAVRSSTEGVIDLYAINPAEDNIVKKLGRLEGHEGAVTALAFSPDSRTLASGSQDTTILLWDVNGPLPTDLPAEAELQRTEGPPKLYLPFDGEVGGVGVIPTRPAEDDGTIRFVPGKKGKALKLDGGLDFPESEAIVLPDSFTVELWFRLDDGRLWKEHAYQSLISSDLLGFSLQGDGAPQLFVVFINRSGHAQLPMAKHTGRFVPGRWYHFAVVHSPEQWSLYLDGRLVASEPVHYGRRASDRIGMLRLGLRGADSMFQGVLDELAIYDYPRTPAQIARDALLAEVPAPIVEKADEPPPEPVLAEAPLLPDDVSHLVEKEEHDAFVTYTFTGPLNSQVLDVDASGGSVWVGTDRGLLQYDSATDRWILHGANAGIPGERAGPIAATGDSVVVDASVNTGPGTVSSKGVYRYERRGRTWNLLTEGFIWDLHWDGARLWLGTGSGAEVWSLDTGRLGRYTPDDSGLLHGDVHAVRTSGDTVWFAMLGDHVKAINDFEGGGVSRLDRRTGKWRSWSEKQGLARAYSCDIAVGENEVWVAHWNEEAGLSVFDLRSEKWTRLIHSDNGIELGGVLLALDGKILWIGQQGGLVRLATDTHEATLYTENDGLPGYIVSGIDVLGDEVWTGAYSYGGGGIRSSGLVRIRRR